MEKIAWKSFMIFKRIRQKYNSFWEEKNGTTNKWTIKVKSKVCYICGKEMLERFSKGKNYRKVRDNFHYTGK